MSSWFVMLSAADRFIVDQITSRSLAAFHVVALQATEPPESLGLASSTVLFFSVTLRVSVSSWC